MRLLFSITYYHPYSSGLSLYVKRLAEILVRSGYKLSVVSCQYNKLLKKEETINGVRVYRTSPLLAISKGFLSLDWLILNLRLVRNQDVIVVNLPQFEGVIPAAIGRILGKKIISIYHCEVVLPQGFFNSIVQGLLSFSNYLTLRLSDKIVTYTEDFAENSKLLAGFKNINYIYPISIEPKLDKRVQNLIREKIGKNNNFIIGVAARLAAEKGIEYLLEAIPIINVKLQNPNIKSNPKFKVPNYILKPITNNLKPEFNIVIAGSLNPVGEQKYKQMMLKLVERYKDHVVFLGELKEEEMGSFYSLLDVLVLPSVNSTESYGMVQVEAMLMGVPVVASDLPGVRVPIQKTGMGIVVPAKDSPKLAEAVLEVLTNRSKYVKTKQAVQNEFSSKKTIEFYHYLLDKEIWMKNN